VSESHRNPLIARSFLAAGIIVDGFSQNDRAKLYIKQLVPIDVSISTQFPLFGS
jgi:hypothetical protein